jgi:hypothetical protein
VPVNAPDSPYTLALNPGTLIADRYRIDGAAAGASATAIRYNAQDMTTGDPVVVKEFLARSFVSREPDGVSVRPHSAEDERDFLRAVRRFALEGALLAEVRHPNLVRVRRVLDANGTTYWVMDRHRTHSLSEFLQSAGGHLAPAQAGRLVQQLLLALEPLHTESMIHRGLSPRSVHVTADGSALLLGFSTRRHVALHATDLVPGFAAFEQYGTRDIGPWTDVYAISAILFYLLTGVTPPSALERAAGEALASPSVLVPGLPAGLVRLVLRGMALLPQQRPHAASELRRQLETSLAEGSGATSRSASASLGYEAAMLGENNGGDETDRGSTLRLAEGGIVVPGEEPGAAAGLLRKLGTAFRRPAAEAPITELIPERQRQAPPAREIPQPAPALSIEQPRVVQQAVAPIEVPMPAPVAAAPRPVDVAQPVARPKAIETLPPAPVPVAAPRAFDVAAEIALAQEEFNLAVTQPNRRRRYSLVAAAALVIGIAGSLALLTRSGAASGSSIAATAQAQPSSASSDAASRPVAPASHEAVEGGAVLQSTKQSDTQTTRPAGQTASGNQRTATTAREAALAPARRAESPAPTQPTGVLPSGSLPRLSIAVNASTDLKIVPPEILVDARTRLTNGQDQVDQGDYQVARRTFRSALTQLDSIANRYPDSQSLRSLRKEIEQADTKAVQACGAENEMRKRRGDQTRACQ